MSGWKSKLGTGWKTVSPYAPVSSIDWKTGKVEASVAWPIAATVTIILLVALVCLLCSALTYTTGWGAGWWGPERFQSVKRNDQRRRRIINRR